MPKPVDDLFKKVQKDNPSYSDSQAWATAWSIYCKSINPNSDSCHKDSYLDKNATGSTVRVAARFLGAAKTAGGWDGKIVGKDFRLTWQHGGWKLEELPQKGKRKLRVATLQNFLHLSSSGFDADAFIPDNIIRRMHVSASDTYDHVKDKISQGMRDAAEEVIQKAEAKGSRPGSFDYLRKVAWYEEQVYFLEVTPENVEPFVAEGKDFSVKVTWTGFSSYSPSSDFQSHDPSYTEIASSSATAARKLYKMLKEEPNALKGISWSAFDAWLKAHKIDYRYNHSVHR